MSETKKIATRQGYGDGLIELAAEHDDVLVLDADLAHATGTQAFREKYPDRFIDVGIAEQNLVGMSVGLAHVGFVPFASSFAVFLAGRGGEIIRNAAAYSNANVKFAGSHSGITPVGDGGTHQCIEDMGYLRAIPNMTILSPCDYQQAKQLVKLAYEVKGPVYLRTSREPVAQLTTAEDKITVGRAQELHSGDDLCIITAGFPVSLVMEAVPQLEQRGAGVCVLNIHTIKPLDTQAILYHAGRCRRVLVVEEHNVYGGLCEAVAATLAGVDGVAFDRIGIEDRFGQSGNTHDVLEAYGMTVSNILHRAGKLLDR